jgi:hypothetical protein
MDPRKVALYVDLAFTGTVAVYLLARLLWAAY